MGHKSHSSSFVFRIKRDEKSALLKNWKSNLLLQLYYVHYELKGGKNAIIFLKDFWFFRVEQGMQRVSKFFPDMLILVFDDTILPKSKIYFDGYIIGSFSSF